MTHIAIIIVNWNGAGFLGDCLGSLENLHVPPDSRFEIILVDNGSTDNSIDLIGKKFPHITLIKNMRNLGFTGGNNVGIRKAIRHKADYFWLINSDTVADRFSGEKLVAGLTKSRSGIAGSKIFFAPGYEFHRDRYREADRGKVIWFAGGLIDWANMYGSHRGVDEVDSGQFDQPYHPDFVTGCSMMISRAVIDRIGLLDERYYLYLEDLDYCLRARRAGFQLVYVPGSVIWHRNSGSSARPGNQLHEYYLTRNRLLVGGLYAPWRTKFALAREAVRFLAGGGDIKRKAVWDAITGRWGKRFVWQKEPSKSA